jgi:hypothetical protein
MFRAAYRSSSGSSCWLFLLILRILDSNAKKRIFTISQVFPQAVIADFSSMGSEFETRPVHVGSALDRVSLGQVFLPVFRFSPDSNTAGILHTHLNTSLARRTSRRTPGALKKQQCSFGYGRSNGQRKKYVHGLFRLQSVTMRGTVSPVYHKPRYVRC